MSRRVIEFRQPWLGVCLRVHTLGLKFRSWAIEVIMFIESIAVMATTISVDEDTRDRLKKLGEKGESYDDIVKQLIDQYIEGRYQKLEEDRKEFEILD